jgi:hypothetical protein
VGLIKTSWGLVAKDEAKRTREVGARKEKRQKSTGARPPKEGVPTRACHAGRASADCARLASDAAGPAAAQETQTMNAPCIVCIPSIELFVLVTANALVRPRLLHPRYQFPHRDNRSSSCLPCSATLHLLESLSAVRAAIPITPGLCRLPLRLYFGSHGRGNSPRAPPLHLGNVELGNILSRREDCATLL